MKRRKYLAVVAALVFGLAGLATAEEGFYGQQVAAQPAAQSDSGAQQVACACGHMHGNLSAQPAATSAPASVVHKDGHANKKSEVKANEAGASTQQEGDPSAPQNQIEYGGGGA